MLYWYLKQSDLYEFKYDHCNWKWVDLSCILTCVHLLYNLSSKIHSLDSNDVRVLDKEVSSKPPWRATNGGAPTVEDNLEGWLVHKGSSLMARHVGEFNNGLDDPGIAPFR
jgi:hypothetical protein